MNIALVLQHMFPGIDLLSDVTIGSTAGVESILSWRREEAQPTLEQLATAWDTVQAQEEAANELRDGLLAAWDSTFTAGEKAFLRPLYDAALAKMDAGDIDGVRELILTAPSISASLDAKKATLVALLPQ